MALPKQPGFTLRLETEQEAGTQVRHFSNRPINKPQFIGARVSNWDPVSRAMSDEQGSYSVGTGGVTLNDDDETLRPLVAENPTRFVEKTFAKLEVLSYAGRAAGLSARSLARMRVSTKPEYPIEFQGTLQRSRKLKLSFVDALKPYLDLNINRLLFTREMFPNIDKSLEGTPVPIIGGEHSDAGAVAADGITNAEKGLVPLIHVGSWWTGEGDPLRTRTARLEVPTGLSYTLNGASGTTERWYGVTFFSGSGETTQTIISVPDGPETLTSTDSITITWGTPDTLATSVGVYRGYSPTPDKRVALKAAGSTTFTDTGVSAVNIHPPLTNDATVPSVEGGMEWDLWIVCRGVVGVQAIYGSDDAKLTAPSRINLNATAVVGGDFLVPGITPDALWSLFIPTLRYIEIDGNWFTAILGRGPRSKAGKDGTVTLAVSTCGITSQGDGSGDAIRQMFPLFQQVLNQFGLQDWRSGAWASLKEFPDGTAIIDTQRVQAAQALTKLFLGDDVGYLGHIYIRQPMTIRDFLQLCFQSSDSGGFTTHQGQFAFKLNDPYLFLDTTTIRQFREYIEIIRLESNGTDDAIEPMIQFQYDYDPDADKYRSEVETARDEDATPDSLSMQKDTRGVRLLRFTRDQRTARDVINRRKIRLRRPRYTLSLTCKLRPGLEVEIGDVIFVTHRDGALPRWELRPFRVLGHRLDMNSGTITLTCTDYAEQNSLSLVNAMGDDSSGEATMDFEMAS